MEDAPVRRAGNVGQVRNCAAPPDARPTPARRSLKSHPGVRLRVPVRVRGRAPLTALTYCSTWLASAPPRPGRTGRRRGPWDRCCWRTPEAWRQPVGRRRSARTKSRWRSRSSEFAGSRSSSGRLGSRLVRRLLEDGAMPGPGVETLAGRGDGLPVGTASPGTAMEARYLPEATPGEELGTPRADVVEPGVPEPAPSSRPFPSGGKDRMRIAPLSRQAISATAGSSSVPARATVSGKTAGSRATARHHQDRGPASPPAS
jgi:hypothetical protein